MPSNDNVIEVNLLQVISKSYKKTRKKFSNFFRYTFRISIKFFYITLLGLASILALYFYDTSRPPFYYSDLVLGSQTINSQILITEINKLNKSIKADPSILDLNPKDLKNIVSIQAYYYIDIDRDQMPDYIDLDNSYAIKHKKDTILQRLSDRFVVRIMYTKFLTSTALKELQNSIVNYLNSIEYNQNLNSVIKNNLLQRLEVTKRQYETIDSATKLYYRSFTETFIPAHNTNQLVFLGEKYQTDLQLYHQQILKLYERVLRCQEVISFTEKPVYTISPALYRENAEQTYKYFTTTNILLIIILTFIILLIFDKLLFPDKNKNHKSHVN